MRIEKLVEWKNFFCLVFLFPLRKSTAPCLCIKQASWKLRNTNVGNTKAPESRIKETKFFCAHFSFPFEMEIAGKGSKCCEKGQEKKFTCIVTCVWLASTWDTFHDMWVKTNLESYATSKTLFSFFLLLWCILKSECLNLNHSINLFSIPSIDVNDLPRHRICSCFFTSPQYISSFFLYNNVSINHYLTYTNIVVTQLLNFPIEA